MKKCPYCAEEIQDAAIICPYCGRDLQSPIPQGPVPPEPPPPAPIQLLQPQPTKATRVSQTTAPKAKIKIPFWLFVGGSIFMMCLCGVFIVSAGGDSDPTPTSTLENSIAAQSVVINTFTATLAPTETAMPSETSTIAPTQTAGTSRTPTTLPTDTLMPTAMVIIPTPIFPLFSAPSTGGGGSGNSGAGFDNNGDGKVTCKDFSTQADAQAAYRAGHDQLDGNDNDGLACESLP